MCEVCASLQHHLCHCWFLCVIMCWEERTVITEEQKEALKSASTRKCWLTSDPSRATGLAPVVLDSMMLLLQIHVSIFIVVKSCNVKIETRQQTAPWSDLNDVVFIPVCQNWIGNYQRSKNSLNPPTEQTLHTSSFSYNLCCRDLLPNKAERRFLTAVMLMLFQSLGKHTHILGLISGLHKFFVFVIMNNRSVPVEDHVSTLLYVLLLFCIIFSFQHPFPAPVTPSIQSQSDCEPMCLFVLDQ